jgi:hypothetical protein
MNQNLVASFTHIVVRVVFFAVILYQPDVPPAPVSSAAAPLIPVEAQPPAPPAAPAIPVGPFETKATLAPMAPAGIAEATRRLPAGATAERSEAPKAAKEPARKRAAAAATETRGAFTQVRDGESLADVAARVYGESGDAKALWSVNRDLVEREDSPLRPGTLLRTP